MSNFRSSFSSFASKYGKDNRFKGVEKMSEKEKIFNSYVEELYKKEKEERKERKEKVYDLLSLADVLCSELVHYYVGYSSNLSLWFLFCKAFVF